MEKMLVAEVIGLVQSDWSSQIVIEPKKDGKPRCFVDYWKRNEDTIPDSYPIPRMNGCIDSHRNHTIYPALGANWGY